MLALLALAFASAAFAHKPSDSYLSLAVDGAAIAGQWDIALRDLDFALGLDADQDGAITWGEVNAKRVEIVAYATSRLALGPADAPCRLRVRDLLVDHHSDGAYAVLRFAAACGAAPATLDVGYRLLFDLDPQHRGLLKLSARNVTRTAVFADDAPSRRFVLDEPSLIAQFAEYLKEGVLHIFAGFDHVLFLLSLLLPAVLVRSPLRGQRWAGAPSFRYALCDVFKVVTAFTVAHSITLSLAALELVSLPSRLVESAIAVSVVLAALNNVRPVIYGGRWVLAFVFGLVHGFGFASVLMDLGLPRESLLLVLVAFNAGVELGQLAIVTLFLPIAFALRDTPLYRKGVVVAGSLAVAAVASVWLAERALHVELLRLAGN